MTLTAYGFSSSFPTSPHSSAPSHLVDLKNREELEREGKGCMTFCFSLGCPDTGQLCTDNRRVSLGDENPLWQIIESMRIFNNNGITCLVIAKICISACLQLKNV